MRPSRTTFPSRCCSSIYQSSRSQTRPFGPRAMQQHIKRAYQSIMTSIKLQILRHSCIDSRQKISKGELAGLCFFKNKMFVGENRADVLKAWIQQRRFRPNQEMLGALREKRHVSTGRWGGQKLASCISCHFCCPQKYAILKTRP